MNDTLSVSLIERISNLDRVLQEQIDRQRAARNALRERLAFQVLHDEEVDALVMSEIEQRADVGMIEGRNNARFSLEALTRLRIRRQMA
jgi:hypothetical protein